MVESLAGADPADKRNIYDELGVDLTYHQDGRVHVAAGVHVLRDRVGGATRPLSTCAPWEAWLVAAWKQFKVRASRTGNLDTLSALTGAIGRNLREHWP